MKLQLITEILHKLIITVHKFINYYALCNRFYAVPDVQMVCCDYQGHAE